MKKTLISLIVPMALWATVSWSQEEVVIEAYESSGEIKFATVSNALSYRVEWAPYPGGTWTNFAAASSSMDEIVFPGDGVVTAIVPMVYRVVATVTNRPPSGMSLIPAGEFVMGGDVVYDELPQHTVYISAFYIDKYEVTKALWDEVKAHNFTNGYDYSVDEFGNPLAQEGKATNHPVHTVNWFDVVKWCNARSEMEGVTPVYYTDAEFTTVYKTGMNAPPHVDWSANGYRLPTEAEWEKAARGGVAGKRFPWGDTITHSNANYSSWSGHVYDTSSTRGYHPTFNDENSPYTSPVGYFVPNGYGIYDMAGNVWEWCWDWYNSSYYNSSPSDDPHGPPDGSNRVLRGGSWIIYAGYSRVAARYDENPNNGDDGIGFRCARGL